MQNEEETLLLGRFGVRSVPSSEAGGAELDATNGLISCLRSSVLKEAPWLTPWRSGPASASGPDTTQALSDGGVRHACGGIPSAPTYSM